MTDRPAWMRNEFQQINTNFSDTAVVERYEAMMGEFRDLAREDAAILSIQSRSHPFAAAFEQYPACLQSAHNGG